MNQGKIAVRYAKALYTLAHEENLHELVRIDMEVIISLLSGVEEFKYLINNPVLKPSVKIEFLKSLFDDKFQKISMNFLELITQNNRLNYLESMARIYINLYKKNQGVASAILTTPEKIDHNIRLSIIKFIEKRLNVKIELEEKNDENLIGGFILRIGNLQIDASILNQLEKIKKELINN